MKKLRLKALNLGATEILSREQLRSINGGCTSDSDCTGDNVVCNSFNVCMGGYDTTGSGGSYDGGITGSGDGGMPPQTCNDAVGAACPGGNWLTTQIWDPVSHWCGPDPNATPYCG
jgi:hypothetical protein